MGGMPAAKALSGHFAVRERRLRWIKNNKRLAARCRPLLIFAAMVALIAAYRFLAH
jgi:hypothetical protein